MKTYTLEDYAKGRRGWLLKLDRDQAFQLASRLLAETTYGSRYPIWDMAISLAVALAREHRFAISLREATTYTCNNWSISPPEPEVLDEILDMALTHHVDTNEAPS